MHLIRKGYIILEERWRYRKAEIDIIARKRDILHIIEVKTRSYDEIANPEDAVNYKKKQLLIEAANEYVIQNDLDIETQFDIFSLIKIENKWKINHITDAFRPFF